MTAQVKPKLGIFQVLPEGHVLLGKHEVGIGVWLYEQPGKLHDHTDGLEPDILTAFDTFGSEERWLMRVEVNDLLSRPVRDFARTLLDALDEDEGAVPYDDMRAACEVWFERHSNELMEGALR